MYTKKCRGGSKEWKIMKETIDDGKKELVKSKKENKDENNTRG